MLIGERWLSTGTAAVAVTGLIEAVTSNWIHQKWSNHSQEQATGGSRSHSWSSTMLPHS
jgi:hypothetical protein